MPRLVGGNLGYSQAFPRRQRPQPPKWRRRAIFATGRYYPVNSTLLNDSTGIGRTPFPCRPDRRILARPPGRARATSRDERHMGAKHFGARITRLEDPALLTGRGQFVDDMSLPGALHAAFVRSPHAHARFRKIDSAAARAMPGIHAVLTADDMPPRIATGQIPMLVPNPAIRTPRTQIALARDEVCYVGQTVAVVIADSRASRGRRRGRGRDRLRAVAGGERRPRRGESRRGPRARRSRLEHRGLRADELRRRRGRVQECAACVRGGDASASRRGDDARRAARCWRATIRPPTCSMCGRRRRRRISAAAPWPICSSAIWNRSG